MGGHARGRAPRPPRTLTRLCRAAPNRDIALARLHTALHQYQVSGVPTNLDFLSRCAAHPAFVAGGVDTGFIEEHWESLMEGVGGEPPKGVVALAALGVALGRKAEATEEGSASSGERAPARARRRTL